MNDIETADGRNAGPGAWTADGFAFEGEGRFHSSGSIDAGTDYTLQTLVDAKADDQIFNVAYLLSVSWNNFALALRKKDNAPKAYSFFWNQQGAAHRPYIYNASHQYAYGTAIMNGTDMTAAFFDGTTAPTSGGGFYQYDSLTSYSGSGYALGGYGSADGQFVGTVKFLRYYNRSLSDAEVAHNRRVDDYRYFGIYEPETTNVVVASTYAYLEGYDACGPYEVDGSYTFAAPATVTAPNGIEYACDGYIVETQDGIGWANATHHDGTSYLYETSAGTVPPFP